MSVGASWRKLGLRGVMPFITHARVTFASYSLLLKPVFRDVSILCACVTESGLKLRYQHYACNVAPSCRHNVNTVGLSVCHVYRMGASHPLLTVIQTQIIPVGCADEVVIQWQLCWRSSYCTEAANLLYGHTTL